MPGQGRGSSLSELPPWGPPEGWAGEAHPRLTLGAGVLALRVGPGEALWLLRGVSVLVQCLSASPSEFRAAVFLYLFTMLAVRKRCFCNSPTF